MSTELSVLIWFFFGKHCLNVETRNKECIISTWNQVDMEMTVLPKESSSIKQVMCFDKNFRTIGLSKNLLAMDESLSCDPLYLGKVI
jgi:hypothetical protein